MIELPAGIQDDIIQYLDDTATSLLRATCCYYRDIITFKKCINLCMYAINYDNIDLLKMSRHQWSSDSFQSAVSNDSFKCAQFLYDNNCQIDALLIYDHCSVKLKYLCYCIIIFNYLEFAAKNYPHKRNDDGTLFDLFEIFNPKTNSIIIHVLQVNRSIWSINTANLIAMYGSRKTMEYFINNGGEHNEDVLISSCYNQSAEILEYLHEIGYDMLDLYDSATVYDSIECVKYLNAFTNITNEDISAAAYNGAARSFCYMAEKYGQSCITGKILTLAIIGGSVDILKYIFRHATINGLNLRDNEQSTININTNSDELFIRAVDSKCADYLRQIGWPWSKTLYYKAIQMDNLKCLKYLFEHNCPYFEELPVITSLYDAIIISQKIRVDLLKYAYGECNKYLLTII